MGRYRRPPTTAISTAAIKLVVFVLLPFALESSAFVSSSISTASWQSVAASAMSSSASAAADDGKEWTPLTDLLRADPSELCRSSTDASSPRLAKDEGFALEVQKIWKEEVARRRQGEGTVRAVGKPISYQTSEGTPLYGYVARPETVTDGGLPGILLFHTGAGPHDVFLRWKAESLVTNPDIGGCVCLICDIISDDTGWAWSSDRTKYNDARTKVFQTAFDGNGKAYRPELQRRVQAAVDALKDLTFVDSTRIGSLGFCMGGHPCLEIGRMNISGMKAAVTFHGVFDSVAVDQVTEVAHVSGADNPAPADRPCCLVCNGEDDPFVKSEDLEKCKQTFENNGWEWNLVQYERTRHGFTNPAQDLNPSDAFAFNEDAAWKSWKSACDLLKDKIVN